MVSDGPNPHPSSTREAALFTGPPLDPDPFFRLVNEASRGARVLAAVETGISCGIFEELRIPRTPDDLADALHLEPGIAEILCEAYVDAGLVKRQGSRFVNLPPADVFLSETSPYSQAWYVRKEARSVFKVWERLYQAFLKDQEVSIDGAFSSPWQVLGPMAQNALAGRLQATMAIIRKLPRFGMIRRVLDIGGGHGLYAIATAALLPECRAFVMDLPGVTDITASFIRAYNTDRVHVIPGNFYSDPLGGDYDLIISSSNPSGRLPRLVPEIAHALAPGGYFVDLQPVRKRQKSPLSVLERYPGSPTGIRRAAGQTTPELPFPEPAYRSGLCRAGLTITGEYLVKDNFQPDMWLELLVAENREDLSSGGRTIENH